MSDHCLLSRSPLKHAICLLSVVLTCFFPCGVLFLHHRGPAHPTDMLPFFLFYLMVAALLLLGLLLILRDLPRASLMTTLCLLVLENFSLVSRGIKRILPGFRSMFLLVLAALALLGILIFLLRRKPRVSGICAALSLGLGCVLILNLIPGFGRKAPPPPPPPEVHMTPEDLHMGDYVFSGEKKNVYFCIFDEYPGPESLRYFYDVDNEPFLSGLEALGFQVSRTSRNTESVWTDTLLPNIMNLNYVVDNDMPLEQRRQWLGDPFLYRLFRENDYQLNLLNHHEFVGSGSVNQLINGHHRDPISMDIYRWSIFCEIPKVNRLMERVLLRQSPNGPYDTLMNMSDAFRQCWQNANQGPTLTVVYFQCPHTPFVVDGEGNPIGDPALKDDWRIPELYLGQVSYMSDLILDAVTRIRQHDPRAVILLLSDHGARTPGHLVNQYGGPMFDTVEALPYMQNVLCAVYAGEDTPEIEGDTCINAIRKTFDHTFGLNLGTLEVPTGYALSEKDCQGPFWSNQ